MYDKSIYYDIGQLKNERKNIPHLQWAGVGRTVTGFGVLPEIKISCVNTCCLSSMCYLNVLFQCGVIH